MNKSNFPISGKCLCVLDNIPLRAPASEIICLICAHKIHSSLKIKAFSVSKFSSLLKMFHSEHYVEFNLLSNVYNYKKPFCVCLVKPLCWLMCCPQKWICILYIHWVLCGREFLLGSLYLCGHNLIMMQQYSIIRQHNSEGCSESSSQSRWRTISQKWRRGAVKRRCAICAIRMFSRGKNGARQ